MSTICLTVKRTALELITNRTEMLYQKRDITDPKTDTTACNRTTQADADGRTETAVVGCDHEFRITDPKTATVTMTR